MQPLQHLTGAERLLADAFKESDQTRQIEIEQIDSVHFTRFT
jgi:hypothetical protein